MVKRVLQIAIPLTLVTLIAATGFIVYRLSQPAIFISPEINPQVLSSSTNSPFLSAEGSSSNKLTTDNLQLTTKTNHYQVIGFLPYWLLNQTDYIQYDKLTHIAYFGIEFDEHGEIITQLEDGTQELGYHRLHQNTVSQIVRRSRETRVQPILTVKILNNEGIQAAINPDHRSQIINKIIKIVNQRNFTGINIDFEYIKTPPPEVKSQFTDFIKELRTQLNNYQLTTNNYQLSLDIYSDTAAKQPERLWQLQDLTPYVDYFIVMGYDFHRATTPKAGPVAPIHGAPLRWEEDISTSLSQITQLVPSNQIILGVPYYGYEWRTYTDQTNSTTYPKSGQLASYSRVKETFPECVFLSEPTEQESPHCLELLGF